MLDGISLLGQPNLTIIQSLGKKGTSLLKVNGSTIQQLPTILVRAILLNEDLDTKARFHHDKMNLLPPYFFMCKEAPKRRAA